MKGETGVIIEVPRRVSVLEKHPSDLIGHDLIAAVYAYGLEAVIDVFPRGSLNKSPLNFSKPMMPSLFTIFPNGL